MTQFSGQGRLPGCRGCAQSPRWEQCFQAHPDSCVPESLHAAHCWCHPRALEVAWKGDTLRRMTLLSSSSLPSGDRELSPTPAQTWRSTQHSLTVPHKGHQAGLRSPCARALKAQQGKRMHETLTSSAWTSAGLKGCSEERHPCVCLDGEEAGSSRTSKRGRGRAFCQREQPGQRLRAKKA